MSINVFVGYYEDKNEERNKELQECVRQNIENPYINYVMIESEDRMKYNDFFRFMNSYSGPNDVNVIANFDIYFDVETSSLLESIKKGEMYALCRWEKTRNGSLKFANRPDSQDVWAFRGYVDVDVDFHIGYAGCDNRIAKVFADAGWKVRNPSKSIKTVHVHNSGVRNYKVGKRNTLVVPGPYLTLTPTTLEEIR